MKKINKVNDELLEKAKEFCEKDTEGYVIITDNGIAVNGNGGTILTYLTILIKELLECGAEESDIKECIELAKMSEEELHKKVEGSCEALNSIKDLLKELKEMFDEE